jgi:hypothetical protein
MNSSAYEDDKLKTVDFGPGMLRWWSKDGRIVMSEVTFFSTPSENMDEGNVEIVVEFDKWLDEAGLK